MRIKMLDGTEAMLERTAEGWALERDWGGCTVATHVRSGYEWVRLKAPVEMSGRRVRGVSDLLAASRRETCGG